MAEVLVRSLVGAVTVSVRDQSGSSETYTFSVTNNYRTLVDERYVASLLETQDFMLV